MASKSEELLAGDDIKGILAVIDSDILAEPIDLETEFATTVFKIQDINSESWVFSRELHFLLIKNVSKTFKG